MRNSYKFENLLKISTRQTCCDWRSLLDVKCKRYKEFAKLNKVLRRKSNKRPVALKIHSKYYYLIIKAFISLIKIIIDFDFNVESIIIQVH
jgi:hypothetical protein